MGEPYCAFRFLVETDGKIIAGFTEVSGLRLETAVETYREGGVNNFVHKLPKETTQSDLVLQHGMTDFELWNWYYDFQNGKANRKNISIILLNTAGERVMRWDFQRVYPIKWEGPTFSAENSKVAIESLTLAHHGFSQVKV